MTDHEAIRLLATDLAAALSDGGGKQPHIADPYQDGPNHVLLVSDAADSRKWMKLILSPEMVLEMARERFPNAGTK
jgi:hypothetical protein